MPSFLFPAVATAGCDPLSNCTNILGDYICGELVSLTDQKSFFRVITLSMLARQHARGSDVTGASC